MDIAQVQKKVQGLRNEASILIDVYSRRQQEKAYWEGVLYACNKVLAILEEAESDTERV